jgi:hypothetical protein
MKTINSYNVTLKDLLISSEREARKTELFDWLVLKDRIDITHARKLPRGLISRSELMKRWGITSYYLNKMERLGEIARVFSRPAKYRANDINILEEGPSHKSSQ